MNPRFLELYNQELRHVRETGAEFSRAFPKIARRLGMGGIEVEDPYVERLLEGFAFLAARVQMKQEAEYPQFALHLLDLVYPHYGTPTPAMAIARFEPAAAANLSEGYAIPRGSRLRTRVPAGEQSECEFLTAHPLTLWPLDIEAVRYQPHLADLQLARNGNERAAGALRLTLKLRQNANFKQLNIDDLPICFSGPEEIAYRLAELVLGHCCGVAVVDVDRRDRPAPVRPAAHVATVGFDDAEAVLPYPNRSFGGYRLLHEYFAFPHRFLFFNLKGLGSALRQVDGNTAEVVILLERNDDALAPLIDRNSLALYCTPAINLFEKRIDRIELNEPRIEHHLVPEKRRPLDYEVFQVLSLEGYTHSQHEEVRFHPFYAGYDTSLPERAEAYFTVRREQRLLAENRRRTGHRSAYLGSEVFVSLVDPKRAPYLQTLKQLGGTVLVTNRDLTQLLPMSGHGDFALRESAPVDNVSCLRGPSAPIPALLGGEIAWRLISHLSLNYLSLAELKDDGAVRALRELLKLYALRGDPALLRQVDGINALDVEPVTRRLPGTGPILFGRGLAIRIGIDDDYFAGTTPFLLGMVLDRFFARHASMNSFTETTLVSRNRGELKRWPVRIGTRPVC